MLNQLPTNFQLDLHLGNAQLVATSSLHLGRVQWRYRKGNSYSLASGSQRGEYLR